MLLHQWLGPSMEPISLWALTLDKPRSGTPSTAGWWETSLAISSESAPSPGTSRLSALVVAITTSCNETCAPQGSTSASLSVTSKKYVDSSGASMTNNLRQVATTTSWWSGTFTLTNLLLSSTSIQQLSRLSVGLLTRMGSLPLAVAQLTDTLGSGTLTRSNRFMPWTQAHRYATWCSQRRLMRSLVPTATRSTRSSSGATLACRRFKLWLVTLVEFSTFPSVPVVRILSQVQETRPYDSGTYSPLSHEACLIQHSRSSHHQASICVEPNLTTLLKQLMFAVQIRFAL